MRAESIEQIREHLARGGKVRGAFNCKEWRVRRILPTMELQCESNLGVWAVLSFDLLGIEWELLPIEEDDYSQKTVMHRVNAPEIADDCEIVVNIGGDPVDELEAFTQHALRLFVKPDDLIGKLLHAAVGISGEAGEILDCIKKTWIYEKNLDSENLLEECGDLLFYTAALLHHSGWTLREAMEHNKAKLAKRYPQGYTDQAARDRADKQ